MWCRYCLLATSPVVQVDLTKQLVTLEVISALPVLHWQDVSSVPQPEAAMAEAKHDCAQVGMLAVSVSADTATAKVVRTTALNSMVEVVVGLLGGFSVEGVKMNVDRRNDGGSNGYINYNG